jgi:hypothetical protein
MLLGIDRSNQPLRSCAEVDIELDPAWSRDSSNYKLALSAALSAS